MLYRYFYMVAYEYINEPLLQKRYTFREYWGRCLTLYKGDKKAQFRKAQKLHYNRVRNTL